MDQLLTNLHVGALPGIHTLKDKEPHIVSVKLDAYYKQLKTQILQYQSPTIGLFPSIGSANNTNTIAHVRDTVYCAAAIWALHQAYKKIDHDQGRAHELGQAAVKSMRGILLCWIRQADKVEKFKCTQNPACALHSTFDLFTGDPTYKDDEHEHLQIDAVALFILYLVQMISSGLQIIYSTDEVNFVQNLVFYVERAYRIPDYGMWERGSKYNNGSTEIHASSLGMVKAALEAINGCNLFGENGAAWSVVFVDIDAHNRNRTIFETILPRESNSKNTDASLLAAVCWPAYGIHENLVRNRTVDKVIRKLKGNHGIKRFLRDGYKTTVEDKNRKYYKPAEIKNFDNIESEWPMFFVYLLIDSIFRNDKEDQMKYQKLLDDSLFPSPQGDLLPMYYYTPRAVVELERVTPGSQKKVPSLEGTKAGVFLWGQSVYFISKLLVDGLLGVNDLDCVRRYLPATERPTFSNRYSKFQGSAPDLVIQIVLISETSRLQQLLATYGIETQTPHQIEPIQIWSPKQLTKAYEYLGVNHKLGLTGRPSRPFGSLSTSKIFRTCGKTVLCYPLLFECSDFYLAQDIRLVMDDCKNDLAFLAKCWKLSGRPTWCMVIRENAIRGQNFSEFLHLLSQFKKGDVDGIRVRLGRLQSFISSAAVEHLDFLNPLHVKDVFTPFQEKTIKSSFKSLTEIPQLAPIGEEPFIVDENLKHMETDQLVQYVDSVSGINSQVKVLKILYERNGPFFHINGMTVSERLERLIDRAGAYKNWWAVRMCSALVGKMVDSLAPSITAMLVRGKQITVGVFGYDEEVLDKPVGPNELKTILYSKCLQHDICLAVVQQELILAIGKLISRSPELFNGILKIRIGWFVRAMELELEMAKNEDKDKEVMLNELSPHQLQRLLWSILTKNETEADFRTPFQKRQLDGALSRVPKDFYDKVWEILEKTAGGIKVAGYLLPQQPTQSDMTMYELNFSLLVEQMLSKISDPSYRQLVVEAFMVVSTILSRNPELMFHQSANMDKIIQEAYDEFQQDLNLMEGTEKQDDMHRFYNTPHNVRYGTTAYISKAVIKNLLDGDLRVMSEDMCCVS